MSLLLTALLPILAGFALILSAPQRRGELAFAAGLVLALTAALAVAAIVTGAHFSVPLAGPLQVGGALTPVSAVMLVLVPLIALPVTVRAALSEAQDGLARLVGLLVVFGGGMELVVLADDLLLLLVGWEIIGAASWALIAHHWRDSDTVASGAWAFIVTRVGDLGLFVAVMALFAATGSFRFEALGELDGAALGLVATGLLVSAAAKAAQVPFSPWLFRAMDGPTPVSALLHSATLVAAGPYLVVRVSPFLGDAFAAGAIAVGLATALAGGVVALLNNHAKRLLAASTSAHLGLMFTAAGAGFPGVALLHLVAHAAMKATLFLEAGTAHTLRGTYELHRLRIGNAVPGLAWMSLLPVLALAGVPPLGAAWTKEKIVAAAEHADMLLALGVIVAGALSAAYAFRFHVSVFSPGPEVPRERIPARAILLVPSGALTLGTLALCVLWLPFVGHEVGRLLGISLPSGTTPVFLLSMAMIAAGVAAGIRIAHRRPDLGAEGLAARLADWFGLPALLERGVARPAVVLARVGARVDDIVLDALPRAARLASRTVPRALAAVDDRVVDRGVRLSAALSQWFARQGDRFGERASDGIPSGTAFLVGRSGTALRRLQTGFSHHYYAIVAVGCAAAIAMLAFGA